MTTIKQCSCKEGPAAEFQDKIYGKGNRVHNIGGSAKGREIYICTVCGNKK